MSEEKNLNEKKSKSVQTLSLLHYALPNLFTAASAFLGIISVLASVNKNFELACIYLILSLVCDGLDGRVARLTNTTSKFGVEFDSLADLVAFGVAPAMLFYFCVGYQYGKLGSLIAGMYVVFGAIRLARFNITTQLNEPNVFIGVPIPTAALIIAMWIMIYVKYPIFAGFEVFILLCVIGMSLLMVSNVRYPSFKKIDVKKANIRKAFISIIIVFSLIYLYPVETLALSITAYLIYGLARACFNLSYFRKKS